MLKGNGGTGLRPAWQEEMSADAQELEKRLDEFRKKTLAETGMSS